MRHPVDIAAVCVVVLLILPNNVAFIAKPHPRRLHDLPAPTRTRLRVVKSKPPRNKRSSARDTDNTQGAWNKLKKIVYDGVDSVASIVDESDEDQYSSVQKGRISQGYDSGMKRIAPSNNYAISPAERILMKGQSASGVRQSAGVTSIQQRQREQRQERESTSSFDTFKAGIYGVVDFVTGPPPSKADKSSQRRRQPEPTEQNDIAEPNTLAVPSRLPFNQIREQEARARAEIRNEKIREARARKDTLYKVVDKLEDAVDALPEAFDAAEASVKEAIQFSKAIPGKLENTVNRIQAVPEDIGAKASATKQSIRQSYQSTKAALENTKTTVKNTQDTAREAVTNVKVLVGLEKPKPKPPKTPPPPRKKPKEIALDLASKAAGATASVAWKGTKALSSVAWKGAKAAYTKSVESIGPAIEDARQGATVRAKKSSAAPDKVPKPPKLQEPTSETKDTSNRPKNSKNIETPEQLAKEVTEAQALAKEVEEALEMAERALQISTQDKLRSYEDDSDRRKKK